LGESLQDLLRDFRLPFNFEGQLLVLRLCLILQEGLKVLLVHWKVHYELLKFLLESLLGLIERLVSALLAQVGPR
jgi:hypothetical protein